MDKEALIKSKHLNLEVLTIHFLAPFTGHVLIRILSFVTEPVGGRLALIGSTAVWKEVLTVAMLIIESTSPFHLTVCGVMSMSYKS